MTPTPSPPPSARPQASEHTSTLADTVAAAVLAMRGVTRLHTGTFGEVATYLPGRRVDGIRLDHDTVEVHVVVTQTADLRATAAAVRATVEPLVGRLVDVFIEDLELDRSLDQPGH